MRQINLVLTMLALAAADMHRLEAQVRPLTRGSAQLSGTVVDSESGAPIVRASVCVMSPMATAYGRFLRCSDVDSLGRYTVDSLPQAEWRVEARCTGATIIDGTVLGDALIATTDSARATWNITAGSHTCDQRPLERVHGDFSGFFYTNHLHDSWFFVDARGRSVAITTFHDVVGGLTPFGDARLGPGHDGRCFSATLRGTLSGPYEDVHQMLTRYRLDVVDVVKQAPADSTLCRGRNGRFLPRWEVDADSARLARVRPVDLIIDYLNQRFALRRESAVLVMCGATGAELTRAEVQRLRASTAAFVSTVLIEPHCFGPAVFNLVDRKITVINIYVIRSDPFDATQLIIEAPVRSDARGRADETARFSIPDGRLISVTFDLPKVKP